MVNDPTLEREKIGGNEEMGDPTETDPGRTRREGYGMPENPDEGNEGLPEEQPRT